jgi:hypothetical protein
MLGKKTKEIAEKLENIDFYKNGLKNGSNLPLSIAKIAK